MLYFISDQHFGHSNIIKYCNRPFDDVIQNADFMYRSYQETVTDDDVVVFLGDIALFRSNTKEPFKQMFKSMKGKKFLVLGNHDSMSKEFYKECGFADIRKYHLVGDIMLCHYPLGSDTEYINLRKIMLENAKTLYHGHIHNKDVSYNDGVERTNFSVEKIGYKPYLINNKTLENYFLNLYNK